MPRFWIEVAVGVGGVATYNVFFNPAFKDELMGGRDWRAVGRDILIGLISIQVYKLMMQ